MKKILLSIAGFDPSSGAGLLLDLKVFQQLNLLGVGILTSITAQNTREVKKVHCIPPDLIWEQYKTLKEDVDFSGIKVGMVGSKDNIQIMKKILSKSRDIPIVVDPVFRSSSGAWLLEKEFIHHYIGEIRGLASLLTPNLDEAFMISGIRTKNGEKMKEAAKNIFSLTNIPCLIKGGDFKETIIDLLYDGREFYYYEKEKIQKKVHGTGCFFSSSLLCFLAKGNPLEKACRLASQLTHQAIKKAIRIGDGQYVISFPL